jgi:hypothetical protein
MGRPLSVARLRILDGTIQSINRAYTNSICPHTAPPELEGHGRCNSDKKISETAHTSVPRYQAGEYTVRRTKRQTSATAKSNAHKLFSEIVRIIVARTHLYKMPRAKFGQSIELSG